jgi:hypothetical protein
MQCPINYPDEFVDLVNNHTQSGDFIGFGNPNAKILIIGKEQALDPNNSNSSILKDMNSCSNHNQWIYRLNKSRDTLNSAERYAILYEIETKQNHEDWKSNIITRDTSCIVPYSIVNISGYTKVLTNKNKKLNPLQSAMVEWGKIFNPLWPYYELPSSADIKTWTSYQKLVYGTDSDFSTYCLWKDAFVTEMSQEPSTTSNGISNSAVAASVNYRIFNILSKPFFRNFPYVVLACGKYVNAIKIKKMFGATPDPDLTNNKHFIGKGNSFWVYSNPTSKQKIILTRQFSNGISDALITAIRKVLGLIP